MTSSRREERKRRWQERKYHERLALLVAPILAIGLIVVLALSVSWASTPSPQYSQELHALVRSQTKLDNSFNKYLKVQTKEARTETNAWKESVIVNDELAKCYAATPPDC